MKTSLPGEPGHKEDTCKTSRPSSILGVASNSKRRFRSASLAFGIGPLPWSDRYQTVAVRVFRRRDGCDGSTDEESEERGQEHVCRSDLLKGHVNHRKDDQQVDEGQDERGDCDRLPIPERDHGSHRS